MRSFNDVDMSAPPNARINRARTQRLTDKFPLRAMLFAATELRVLITNDADEAEVAVETSNSPSQLTIGMIEMTQIKIIGLALDR